MLVLCVGATAADREALEREASLIRGVLERGGGTVDLRLQARCVERARELAEAIDEDDPKIVHLVGSGAELVLERGPLSPDGLAALLARPGGAVECVLLNARFTAERADALLERVRCVVGLPDAGDGASDFWVAFYDALANGDGYAAAFEQGRVAVAARRLPVGWIPRFVTRDLEIFDSATPPPAAEIRTRSFAGDAGERETAAPLYPLWFGTNRALVDANDPAQGFSGERDGELHLGTCQVAVPRSHLIGSVGSGWWRRLLRREDDRLQLDWASLRLLAAESFWADLARALAERDAGERMGLVVIHGYNVSFEAAALRAAQIGFDLQFPGATAFFSWPSRARLARYTADEATIQASEKHIAQFLLDFTRQSGAEAVHVIAHSMGNRGLLRAMQRIVHEVGEDTGVPFGQIVLAAPDEDQEVFAELSAAYRRLARRTTLYVSARDRAVASSTLVHDAPRVGFTPPVTVVPGIDTVEVTNVDVSLLGHGYFAEARDLLHDIHDLLVQGAPPERRFGLRTTATADGRRYWVIGS